MWEMTIRSLFRRYEKWNPVHPTYGAFWGIGVGIGCGVGWGPGFGPEVIGYVGSGCGVGFSVGITLLGLGIGLPSNHLFEVPHNALMVTRGALDAAGAGRLFGKGGRAGDGWGGISSHLSAMLQTPYVSFSSFKMEGWSNIMDLPSMKSTLVTSVKHIADGLQKGKGRFDLWDRGMTEEFTIRKPSYTMSSVFLSLQPDNAFLSFELVSSNCTVFSCF